MSDGRIRIAVLDSGINIHDDYFKEKVELSKSFILNRDVIDYSGHGSLVASTLIEKNKEILLWNYRILDEYAISSEEIIIRALVDLIGKDVNIVLMCLSLVNGAKSKEIKRLCKKLAEEGKVIICSLANGKRISYPAAYNGVIGVSGAVLENKNAMWINNHKRIQVVMDNTPVLRRDNEYKYRFFGKCNSYAAASFGGEISRIITYDMTNSVALLDNLREKTTRHNWLSLRQYNSKRYPEFYSNKCIDKRILQTIEDLTVKYFNIKDVTDVRNYNMFDHHIGLKYDNVYEYLKALENGLGLSINKYEYISRDEMYSVYTIARMFTIIKENVKNEN